MPGRINLVEIPAADTAKARTFSTAVCSAGTPASSAATTT